MTATERLAAPLRQAADRLDARAVLVVTACCASWGVNQVAIKIANAGISPILQAGLRSLFAGVLVFAWSAARGVRLFERDGTLWAGLFAGVLFGAEFLILYVGLSLTTASRAVVLLYLALQSLLDVMVVCSNVVVIVIGGIWSLMLMGMNFNISAG